MNRKERRLKHLRQQIREAMKSGSIEDFPERVFRIHGALRFYVLWLVSETSKNGSDIIEMIDEQSQGRWKPSPGTIYPLLKNLVAEEYLLKDSDGQYHITEKGLEENELIGISPSFDEARRKLEVGQTIEQIESLADNLEENPIDNDEYKERIEELTKRFDDMSDRFR